MYKRRDIREAAVQFLYFADLESGPEASSLQDAFWEIIQEQDLRRLEKAKAKAILHVAQARAGRLTKLVQHTDSLLPRLKAAGDGDKLAVIIEKILANESRMSASVDLLQLAQKKNDSENSLNEHTDAVLTANRSLIDKRREFLELLEDYPQHTQTLEPITAAIAYLNRISDRLTEISDPNSSVGDFEHIRKSSKKIESFRKDTQDIVDGILKNKETIDNTLANNFENYSPERVTPVDRAILRLATYEITMCDDIPRAVSINEAIEIAKRFSTAESSRFINGVLDAT